MRKILLILLVGLLTVSCSDDGGVSDYDPPTQYKNQCFKVELINGNTKNIEVSMPIGSTAYIKMKDGGYTLKWHLKSGYVWHADVLKVGVVDFEKIKCY